MNKLVTLVIFCVCTVSTYAQTDKEDIITDRPDQTEAAALVPAGGLQVETGFVMEKDQVDGIKVTNYTYNTTLIKYGVNENFELRFISEYLGEKVALNENSTSSTKGFSPIALGVKIKLADEKGIWPQTALIGHISTRSGAESFKPEYTAADFRFTFGHTVSEKLAIGYNIGAEWDGESPSATFLYTLTAGYAISPKAGVFIETYSFFPEKQQADHRFDMGFTYKFTPVVQWDISGGIGLNEVAPDSFISTGLSVRLFK